ncbi:O-antigen ligase family protein [Curtobacterium pusillum]|uniref:O-antigen ligase family protein n=1 Tax=Curtobacterium pusillum TaxID=69373 RepID=UPI0011A0A899|nr:O-antigen ligase family protein [Curtobacterium pusillum]
MLGFAILAAVILAAACSFRSLTVAVVAALVGYVAVPEVEVWTLALPGVGGVNLGVLVVVVTAALQLVFRARTYLSDVVARPGIWIAFAVWVAGGTITNFIASTSSSAPGAWIEIIVAPPLAYLLLQRLAAEAPSGRRTIAHAVVVIAVVECVVALVIWSGLVEQPFAAAHEAFSYWWDPEFSRALGTTDHPLTLGVVLLVATALLGTIRRNVVVIPAAALFIVTILVTESRAALALAIIAFALVLVRRRLPFVATLGLVMAAVAALATVLVTNRELTTGLFTKLGDDDGSANARLLGLAAGVPLTFADPVVGGGQGASFEIARSVGLGTSFENPLIMLALDWGLVGTLALVVAQALALLRTLPNGSVVDAPGAAVAAGTSAIAFLTFSSYALTGGMMMFAWMVLGLAIHREPTARTEAGSTTRTPVRASTSGAAL